VGILLAAAQAWVYRLQVTADSISYLDMSDGVLPDGDWHRLINGVWSPLYPLLMGIGRRLFPVSAANEIAAAHFLNIGVFVFAFVCFEFFLRNLTRSLRAVQAASSKPGVLALAPNWAYLSIAYSVFLWASISGISMRNLRPDLLMSGFLYLAVGILLQMHGSGARWIRYLALGVVLGIGFLAKAPMLPIGVLILAVSLFVVEEWRPAVKMIVAAFALMMVIGSLYFVPLSRARGHFTLGESAGFNYLVDVDHAGPSWYLQDVGRGRGSFVHPPEQIFSAPRAYAFPLPKAGTHPLRFDPSDWTAGARPRFLFKRQIGNFVRNVLGHRQVLLVLSTATALVLLLGYFLRQKKDVSFVHIAWPICLVGIAGCAMYAMMHIETRYVAAFLVLFWCGIIFSLPVPRGINSKWIAAVALVSIASFLLPMGRLIYLRRSQGMGKVNSYAQAAAALEQFGVHAGDQVARISPKANDIAIERITRATVTAEVDLNDADKFWSAPVATQRDLLEIFALRGVKAVVATSPKLNLSNQSEWTRLGSTQYWVWQPSGQ
jgi:hypothetical protein